MINWIKKMFATVPAEIKEGMYKAQYDYLKHCYDEVKDRNNQLLLENNKLMGENLNLTIQQEGYVNKLQRSAQEQAEILAQAKIFIEEDVQAKFMPVVAIVATLDKELADITDGGLFIGRYSVMNDRIKNAITKLSN